jgi:hypothetical protein
MSKKLECIWSMSSDCSSDCSDDVKEVGFFNNSIKVPVCSNHIEQHKCIMILHKNNYDLEAILRETPEERKREVLILKLAGLDDTEVDL